VCFKHTAQHYAANPNCTLYLNYEHLATNYKKAFWCEKCGTHTWAYIDAYESFTDQMAVTKGTYLLEPSLDKYFRSLEGSRFVATASSMQGWRSGQEDAECLIDCGNSSYLFGVFDGHGGAAVARYTSRELPQDIIARKRNGEGYEDLFKGAFVAVDSKMQQAGPDDLECNTTGCTGCVVYYDTAASTIVCANAGDSRAVICTAGGKAQDLSDDHKIYNTTEESRIKAAGYKIVDGRVEGMLAVPRAFGDFDFKGLKAGPELQAVSVVPDVKVQPLSGTEEFIIIACDGIWDVVSSQQAVDFVRRKLAQGIKAESTVALLLDRCMSSEITEDGVGTDNMSIILIQLQRGDS
jgi:protein phosphatase 2C family protein 2/3